MYFVNIVNNKMRKAQKLKFRFQKDFNEFGKHNENEYDLDLL